MLCSPASGFRSSRILPILPKPVRLLRLCIICFYFDLFCFIVLYYFVLYVFIGFYFILIYFLYYFTTTTLVGFIKLLSCLWELQIHPVFLLSYLLSGEILDALEEVIQTGFQTCQLQRSPHLALVGKNYYELVVGAWLFSSFYSFLFCFYFIFFLLFIVVDINIIIIVVIIFISSLIITMLTTNLIWLFFV